MASIKKLESRVDKIEERNRQVETDKAWELSLTRRLILTAFTYLAVAVYLYAINIPQAWLHAIVPAVALMLSTLTLPFLKEVWLKQCSSSRQDK